MPISLFLGEILSISFFNFWSKCKTSLFWSKCSFPYFRGKCSHFFIFWSKSKFMNLETIILIGLKTYWYHIVISWDGVLSTKHMRYKSNEFHVKIYVDIPTYRSCNGSSSSKILPENKLKQKMSSSLRDLHILESVAFRQLTLDVVYFCFKSSMVKTQDNAYF